MTERITSILAELPDTPGVYEMMDAKGVVIYVGKAKNLKKRVKSYFQKQKGQDIKTQKLVKQITDIHYIEVASENEALILEANFIREKKPKFNVLLRDDQRYLYIKVTNEDFPQLLKVRHISKDGAKYFGPYSYASPVVSSLRFLEKLFSLRNCTHKIEWNDGDVINKKATRSIPCLEYHIKKCSAPCIAAISKDTYKEHMKKVISFLEGQQDYVIAQAKEKMMEAANAKLFEKAASLRDQLRDLESLQEKQHINVVSDANFDSVGYFQMLGKIGVSVFQVRNGRMINQENLILDERIEGTSGEEIIERFIMDFYSKMLHLPQEILMPCKLEDAARLSEVLGVKLTTPLKGDRRAVVDLAVQNAKSWMEQNKTKWTTEHMKTVGASKKLADALGLSQELRRIECYDISHIQGTNTVASMVVFHNGKPDSKHYRSFAIKSLEEGMVDDFASMREVLHRRLSRIHVDRSSGNYEVRKALKKHIQELGIAMDNDNHVCVVLHEGVIVGWGQLQTIKKRRVLTDLKISPEHSDFDCYMKLGHQILASEKKAKIYADETAIDENLLSALSFTAIRTEANVWMRESRNANDASFSDVPDLIIIDGGKGQLSSAYEMLKELHLDEHIAMCALAKREEEIFLPGEKDPIILPRQSDELYLVMRIRDEAHRFAVTTHKKKRSKAMVVSALDQIPGVGPVTKKRLMQVFGDVETISLSTQKQLEAAVGAKIAKDIYKYFAQK